MAEQERFAKAGVDPSPLGPIAQTVAAHEVLSAKDRIDSGDGFALLGAIRNVVSHGLVAPDWLAYAFNRRYYAVTMFRAGSWDDPLAFGRPFPKGTNLAARRKAKIGRIKVFNAVRERLAKQPDTPIDKSLFEEIGRPLGFGATLTETFYYLELKMSGLNPANNRKTAGLRKKPK